MLRRLEKRIYFNSPAKNERIQIIMKNLEEKITLELAQQLADKTDNWSASDVVALCKEAAMRRLRINLDKLEAG